MIKNTHPKENLKPLFLIMQGYWFDEIESGRKTEEYRDNTPFYQSRFLDKKGNFKNFKKIILQEGYHKDARRMIIEFKKIEKNKREFIIYMGGILERHNFDRKPLNKAKTAKHYTKYPKPVKTSKDLLSKVRNIRRKK